MKRKENIKNASDKIHLNNKDDNNNNKNVNDSKSQNAPSVVDMLMGTASNSKKTQDFETMIHDTRMRVWKSLKKGYEYANDENDSDEFLRKNILTHVDMTVLYVDLVGSTNMILEMPPERVATIMSSFAQEMARVVNQYNGYVLKFVGDAVIAYFTSNTYHLMTADNAVNCARSMLSVIQHGINPVLDQYDYPELQVKIGLDAGQSIIVRYGSDPKLSHVDLLGPVMNIAAKIQNRAKPNQILIGLDVYNKLHPDTKKKCQLLKWGRDKWSYRSRMTGKIYDVYEVQPILKTVS